jgi:hypothetical protein
VAAGLAAGPLAAQHIEMRVSVKVIVSATDATPPPGITPDVFYQAASNANLWMDSYYRGYRYTITEVVSIGGPTQGGASGPSQWFQQDTIRNTDSSLVAAFKSMVQTNPLYLLRSDQINVYVSTGYAGPGNSGGGTPIPPGDLSSAVQIYADNGPWWMVHELGHFFGLIHTFTGEDTKTCTPGSSGLADTLPDSTCWTTENPMAEYSFGLPYASLSASQQTLVDNTFFNAMSYHDALTKNTVESVRTELQLDLVADMANTYRSAFVSGRTVFVSTSGSDSAASNSSTSPYATVGKALTRASPAGGDIILLRAGSYTGALSINQPVTLRATRQGQATLGL